MNDLRRFAYGLMVSTALCAVPGAAARAQTAANLAGTSLLLNFSTLNNTAAGKAVLSQNLSTSISLNNGAGTALQAQGIKDNTTASLVGGLQNGISVADGLGTNLSAVFAVKNTVAQNFSATAVSANYQALLNQVTTLTVGGDSAFTKNFFANGSSNGRITSPASGPSLPAGGIFNVYDAFYQPLPANKNTVGNTRPYAVAPSSYRSFTAPDYFGVSTTTSTAIWPTLNGNAAFPSGHAAAGFAESMLLAVMVPERYQQLVTRGAEFGTSRIVIGAHYALDVIGARIETTYALVQILNNNPAYLNQTVPGLLGGTVTTTGDFKALLSSATADLRTSLVAGCGTSIAACNTTTTGDRFASAAANQAAYTFALTYGLPAVGATNLDPVVPAGAEALIASRFPYLTGAQQRDVLASTEIASGQALDNGTGYARLNLYAAAGGYGSLNGNVAVTMNASAGGFSAYDTWSNNIGNYVAPSTGAVTVGSLTKNGTGTLELSGAATWTGATVINGGTLLFSGTSALAGALTNNSVLSLTRQDGTAGRVLTVGSYAGGAGSVLAVGAALTGTAATSDRLVLTGGVTAGTATAILVTDTAPGTAAGYNPVGATVVSVPKGQSASAANFTLANGPVTKGLFQYALAFNADPAWILVGLPSADAYRLATLANAAQSLWFDTVALRAERTDALRDAFAADRSVSALGPVWVKVAGAWQSRTDSQSTGSYSSAFAQDASYSLRTNTAMVGLDGGVNRLLTPDDALLVGFNVGSLHAWQKFKGSSTSATFDGATLGASATYLNGAIFNDLSVRADLLTVSVSVPGAAAFGSALQKSDAWTYGVSDTLGYRFALGSAFAEPLVTLAYARSDIGGMGIAGSAVTFPNEDQLRGRAGVRAGTVVGEQAGYRLGLAATASIWTRLAGTSSATLNSGGGAPLLTLRDQPVPTFGEVGLAADFTSKTSAVGLFAKGNYQFARNYSGTSVEAGLRFKF
jgi:hypothetical protein